MKKSLAIMMLAMLAIGTFALVPSLARADIQDSRMGVRMRGTITQYGAEPAFGWLSANAFIANKNGTRREWAVVHAIWADRPDRLNVTGPPTGNFSFSFYGAKLTNFTDVRFNATNLFIAGNWTVVKVTTTIQIDSNGFPVNITKAYTLLVTDAYGELRAPTFGGGFQLSIIGIDPVKGIVTFWMFRFFEIRVCAGDDGKVGIRELVKAARRYKAAPGLSTYNMDIDYNFDFNIDIGDLTTIAANIQG